MRSSSLSVFAALSTLSSVESRIDGQLQHLMAPDTPQQEREVHEYYAPWFGAPEDTRQPVSSDSKVTPNERWFPLGGGASMYDESGDDKALMEKQEKKSEMAIPRPAAFLQQPSQEVHEYYAPWFGTAAIPQDQQTNTKSSGSETWFPFSAASASVTGDDDGLPEQGFHGEDVEHKDGKTSTGDWGGEYQHPPEQSSKQPEASDVTTQPPSALLQERSQNVREYFAPWFGASDVPQVQQDLDTKETGNERWFPFAAASSSMFVDDKQ